MRFTTDRCVECSSPVRPSSLSNIPSNYHHLEPSGRFTGTDYWFCSISCFESALEDYIPSKFHFGKTPDKDPEILAHIRKAEREISSNNDYRGSDSWERVAESLREEGRNWLAEQKSAVLLAGADLICRLYSESILVYEKEERMAAELRAEEEALLEKLKPRQIPEKLRYQHTHILAPSGFGKTTLIQQIILDDLAKPNPPAYVIIDPKGLLVDRISRLDVFNPINGRLADRLIIIDPTVTNPPALSMFSMPPGITDSTAKARALNHLIETFAYVFSSADATLTQRQGIPFGYVVRVVFSMGGDIDTLMDLLESKPNNPQFAPHIQLLAKQDSGARRFFANDFYTKNFADTRQQIKTRLYEIIAKPELMRMFTAKENRLSLFECLQNRKIVLVNTAMAQLGTKASALLGRYFISMTLNAAFSRFVVPHEQWNAAYLVIDEFQDFADEEKTPELLRIAREYNLGVTLAHQAMHSRELSEPLRTSISTNTNIKYSSNPEAVDLNYMARDLRCDANFLKKYASPTATQARFACFVRSMGLDHPFLVDVPFGNIQARPQMSKTAHQELLLRNAAALSDSVRTPTTQESSNPLLPPPSPPSTPQSLATAAPAPPQSQQTAADTPEAGSTW